MIIRATLLLLIASTPITTFAQGLTFDTEEFQALRSYCKDDVERLCPNVRMGGGLIKACLIENKEKMSVGCAQALKKLKDSKK